ILIRVGCLRDDCVHSRLANYFNRSRDGRRTQITKQISGHVSPTPYVRRPAETDSRRFADPTSRVGPAKWRVSHVRFLRGAPDENTRCLDTATPEYLLRLRSP